MTTAHPNNTNVTKTRTRRSAKAVCFAITALTMIQVPAAFADRGPSAGRAGDRIERVHDRRNDHREERREERREDRREDRRDDRREDRREERREDRRDDRMADWRHHRYETWDDWRDFRRTMAAARIVTGMIFGTLPHHHTTVVIAGTTYYFHDDVYFIEVFDNGLVSYKVVAPPVGAVVHALPQGHTTVIIDGVEHFHFEGVHYRPHTAGGFIVVRI